MTNLAPSEEARLMGLAYGAVILNAVPQQAFQDINTSLSVPAGTVGTITLSGGPLASPVAITVTVPAGGYTPLQYVAAFAAAAALNTTLTSAGFFAVAPYGSGPFAENTMPLPEVAFVNAQAFTIIAASTNVGLSVTATGILPAPSVTVRDPITNAVTPYNGYVPIINMLESQYLSATQNQDTREADVWKWNPQEVRDRFKLYQLWQRQMALYLGLPLGTHAATQTLGTISWQSPATVGI
jgi:hypothetical protein